MQADCRSGPSLVAPLHKLAGDISSTISSLEKGNTVLLTSKLPLKPWEIPALEIYGVVQDFLIVYTDGLVNGQEQRAEQWLL